MSPMASTRTWGDILASLALWARRDRSEFVMAAWGGIVALPMLVGAAVMLFGDPPQWLGATMAVCLALCFPPKLYFDLRDRSNRGVKRRPYRRVPVTGHVKSDGSLRAVSWRWAVVAGSVLAAVVYCVAAVSVVFASPNEFVWFVGTVVLYCLALVALLSAAVTHPLADRAAVRLQAALEREYPNATFVILKSAQVSSQIACADPGSVLTSWNDVTFRAVVTVDEDGLRVWDQFWGKRKNVATIPWSRVHGLGLSIAKVRWRYVRAIDLQLTAEHGSPDVGVVLPPAKYNWGFRPLSDVKFRELHAQLGAHLAKSQAQAIVGGETGEWPCPRLVDTA